VCEFLIFDLFAGIYLVPTAGVNAPKFRVKIIKFRDVEFFMKLRDVTCYTHSVTVTCHPTQVNRPRLNPRQKPVLNLPTPEGWQADLTI